MPTTLLKAPVGAGKTESALRILSHTLQAEAQINPFARAWVLLASKRQEVAFRQRLVEYPDNQRVYFNVEFFSFYELNMRLLNMNKTPPRRIQDVARYGLLASILAQLTAAGKLPFWQGVAHTAGFVQAVATLIDELKQNLVFPQAFINASAHDKERELGFIYATYQALLQEQNLVDLEGEAWLALETLRRNPELSRSVRLLMVDGYDQFTPVQAQIIALLSRQSETYVTLTFLPEAERQRTVGKRFERALERLQEAHDSHSVSLSFASVGEVDAGRAPDLQALARAIFTRAEAQPAQAPAAVRLLEVPQEADEVAAVLRHVKGLLLQGVRPDDIIVAVRDWAHYAPLFETYRQAYQLPLLLHYAPSLAQNPALVTFLNTLRLSQDADYLGNRGADRGFGVRAMLDVLRSPYLDVGADARRIVQLEQVAERARVTGGREAWFSAVTAAQYPLEMNDETLPELLLEQEANALAGFLARFFALVTPPQSGTASDYVAWVEALIGADTAQDEDNADEDPPLDTQSLGVLRAIRTLWGQSEAQNRLMARDLYAMNALKTVLHGFLHTQELLTTTFGQTVRVYTWGEFLAELESTLNGMRNAPRDPARNGRVLVTTANNARGLPHAHVFILGLAEGVFPAPMPQDPLLLDSEREALARAGVRIETQAQRVADEGLFYELLSLARQSLTLSRPTIQEGKLWNESHLWRMVRAVFTPESLPIERVRIGEVVDVLQASSLDEVFLAVTDALNQPSLHPHVAGVLAWLRDSQHAPLWHSLTYARMIETRRLDFHTPFDAYTGVLADADNLAWVAKILHADRTYSATQLNHFGACHFQFFAKRLLKLEALKPIQEGMDVLQRGTLYHAILEQTYAEIQKVGWTIAPEHAGAALDILSSVYQHIIIDAPTRYGFRPSMLWREETVYIWKKLSAVVALDFSDKAHIKGAGRVPYAFEWAFNQRIELEDERVPYVVLRGSIDRVDRVEDGLVIIDYKSGSKQYPSTELEKGRNFQMWTYALALRALEPQTSLVGGIFWHIENNTKSGNFAFPKDDVLLAKGKRYVADYIAQAQAGNFAVRPQKLEGGKCSTYCEFAELCRIARTNIYKPWGRDEL